MLAAIAFCPSPPLLVPELAAGAAAELDGLRAACAEAVRRLLATGPQEIIVIGTGRWTSRFPPGTVGTLLRYGVPVTARLPAARPLPAGWYGAPLSLPLTLGAWLLTGADAACSGYALGPDADPAEVGAGLGGHGRRALLVMGDGSARRSAQAPGHVDPRAAGFDAAVAFALATADAAALRDLDPTLAADLLAAGVPAWRAAGHAASRAPGTTTGPAAPTGAASPRGGTAPGLGGWAAELLYDDAPYGVGYFVATWVAR